MPNAMSFSPPSRDSFTGAISNGIEYFNNFVDDSPETCDDVSNNHFINIIMEVFDNKAIVKSRVIIKGSQQCQAVNMVWFVSGRVPGSIVIPCNVTEEIDGDLRKCNLRCQCICGVECGFLHFHVQHPPWMKQTLSLCHYEQYVYLPWNKNHITVVKYCTYESYYVPKILIDTCIQCK